MIAADPYGKFIPGRHAGLPQYVTTTGLVSGNLPSPVPVPANVVHFDTPFLTDIAHNADPSPRTRPQPAPDIPTGPDADTMASADFAHQPAGTYDDEMLNAHFSCGDGRCNENIALSTIHQISTPSTTAWSTTSRTRCTPPATMRCLPEFQLAPADNPAVRNGRSAVPGCPVRHRDGVPAPGFRGVRAQGAAGGPAVPRVQPGHQPGHRGRVRARRLPFRPFDAGRRRRPHQRGRDDGAQKTDNSSYRC